MSFYKKCFIFRFLFFKNMFKKIIKKIFLLFLITIVCLISAMLYFFSEINRVVQKDVDKEIEFVINKGESINSIADNLVANKLLNNKQIFKLYIKLYGDKGFIAGKHTLTTGMNLKEIVKTLNTDPKSDQEKTITILEGWRLDEIGAYLESENLTSKEDFLAFTSNINNLNDINIELPFKVPQNANMEGLLYPDTYRVFKKATLEEIVAKMINNFLVKLANNDVLAGYGKQKLSMYQVLVLASVVEREANNMHDRRLVADVFLKRINKRMRLESCATINYITKKSSPRVSGEDLQIVSPYNTYMNGGLPPTPISNPSIEAIKAVVDPIKNDYYYFLNAPDGKMYYGKTLKEHNANKKYM